MVNVVWRLCLEDGGFVNQRKRGTLCVLGKGKNIFILKVTGFLTMNEKEL